MTLKPKTKSTKSTFQRFKEAAAAKERPAFLPVVAKSGAKHSHLGGSPWLAKGEAWPKCEVCQHTMALWIQLFAADAPKEMRDALDGGVLQWFRCIGKPSADRLLAMKAKKPLHEVYAANRDALVAALGADVFREVVAAHREGTLPPSLRKKLKKSREIEGKAFFLSVAECAAIAANGSAYQRARIVDARGAGRTIGDGEIPPQTFGPKHLKWKRVTDSPRPIDLEIDEWWNLIDELEPKQQMEVQVGWNFQKDKLGGWPSWFQSNDYTKCPRCRGDMSRLVFQVDTSDRSAIPWTEPGIAFLFQCPKHPRELEAFTQLS